MYYCILLVVYNLCFEKMGFIKTHLLFLRKIEDLTFFYRLSPNRGEKGKNG